MSTIRPIFDADPETFPFHQLRVGRWGDEKQCPQSDFGPVHQKTYIETAPDIWEEYEIQFENMQGMSLSYYLDPHGNNVKNPSFYWHPILYPKWSQKDPATGQVSKTKNPAGIKLELFLQRFRDALKRELEKMSPINRSQLMGTERSEMPVDKYVEQIAQFPKYEKTHKTKPNQTNSDKSQGFAISVWSQDETKRKDAKTGGAGAKDKTMRVPDTNTVIYTTFYMAAPTPTTTGAGGGKHKKTKKQIKEEKEQKKKPVTDYQQLKQFIYKADAHPNCSGVNRTVVAETRVLGPSILWKPAEGPQGRVQFKMAEMVIGGWQDSSYNKEMSDERLEKQAKKAANAMEEFGFVHQAKLVIPEKDEDEEDEDEDDEEDDGEGGGSDNDGTTDEGAGGMTFDGHHQEGGPGRAPQPSKKKLKTGGSHIADGECPRDVFDAAYSAGMDDYGKDSEF